MRKVEETKHHNNNTKNNNNAFIIIISNNIDIRKQQPLSTLLFNRYSRIIEGMRVEFCPGSITSFSCNEMDLNPTPPQLRVPISLQTSGQKYTPVNGVFGFFYVPLNY